MDLNQFKKNGGKMWVAWLLGRGRGFSCSVTIHRHHE